MHSPSGNNNQPRGGVTSQTSDNVVRNWSLLTSCCCKPARAPVGVVPTGPSSHVPVCQSCETAFGESVPLAHYTGYGKWWYGTFGCQRRHKVPPPGRM